MGCPTAEAIKQHIIEHEILGIGGSSSSTDLLIIDGYPTYVDTSRGGKRLSTNRQTFTAAKKAKAEDVHLQTAAAIATSKTGYRMLHNGTITGIALQLSSTASVQLHIYRNNILTPLVTLNVNGQGGHSYSVNADFAESDVLQFFIEGICHNPVGWIEVAWRF
jgi:hypothetical protein